MLQEDITVREELQKQLRHLSVEHIEFERARNKLSIIIYTSRPGLLIGRAGSGAEDLRKKVESILRKVRVSQAKFRRALRTQHQWVSDAPSTSKLPEIRIDICEIRTPDMYATLVASSIAEQLEKRMPFRRVIKRTLDRVMMNKEVKGAKILLKGRLDGSEMARRELVRAGRLPLQTIRADIDYAHVNAFTVYSVIGISVWIYKGEKLT